jgi:hypothetical protein
MVVMMVVMMLMETIMAGRLPRSPLALLVAQCQQIGRHRLPNIQNQTLSGLIQSSQLLADLLLTIGIDAVAFAQYQ